MHRADSFESCCGRWWPRLLSGLFRVHVERSHILYERLDDESCARNDWIQGAHVRRNLRGTGYHQVLVELGKDKQSTSSIPCNHENVLADGTPLL